MTIKNLKQKTALTLDAYGKFINSIRCTLELPKIFNYTWINDSYSENFFNKDSCDKIEIVLGENRENNQIKKKSTHASFKILGTILNIHNLNKE